MEVRAGFCQMSTNLIGVKASGRKLTVSTNNDGKMKNYIDCPHVTVPWECNEI